MEDFAPELELEQGEVASLAAIMSHPGYKVIHKIFRSTVDRFTVAILNADSADDKQVLSRVRSAKVAAQIYTAFTNRANQEVADFMHQPRANDKPVDVTENLDFGEASNFLEHYNIENEEESF